MKGFGKIAALALTLAMALALTACGGSGSASSAVASDSASAASASASASSAAASVSAAEAGFESGSIQGDTYTNELFGVQFVLPEGYAFLNDEEMASLNQMVGDLLDDDDILAALESGAAYFDMAAKADDSSNINVVIQYAGTPEAAAIDAAGYLKASEFAMEDQLKAAGMTLKNSELGTYVNPKTGDEFPSLKLTLEMQGQTANEEMICLKADDYFMCVTATSVDEAQIATILENFTLIK